jgi:DNA-binding NarL/FixJ family response regulator
MTQMSVVIVDDHRMTAFSLGETLRSRGIIVSGVEHSASAAMEAVKRASCDVLVTDLDLGFGPSGIDLALQAKKSRPGLGIVVLTAYEDPKLFEPALPHLSRGFVYVVKQQLTRADELVASLELARDYATGAKKPGSRPVFPLSLSQARILRLVARGMSNQAIAHELSMTLDSVNTSVKRLAKKLGIKRDSDTNVRVLLTQRFFDLIGYSGER